MGREIEKREKVAFEKLSCLGPILLPFFPFFPVVSACCPFHVMLLFSLCIICAEKRALWGDSPAISAFYVNPVIRENQRRRCFSLGRISLVHSGRHFFPQKPHVLHRRNKRGADGRKRNYLFGDVFENYHPPK